MYSVSALGLALGNPAGIGLGGHISGGGIGHGVGHGGGHISGGGIGLSGGHGGGHIGGGGNGLIGGHGGGHGGGHVVHSGPAHGDHYNEQPDPFQFEYGVHDDKYYTDFSEHRSGDEYGNIVGEYQVALPDGRIQYVKYTADGNYGGTIMEVSYKGEARHPDIVHHSPVVHSGLGGHRNGIDGGIGGHIGGGGIGGHGVIG